MTVNNEQHAAKSHPILMSAPMVRAILEGRKTQTRRIVKNAHIITCDDRTGATDNPCPYGVPGDELWVRETWQDIGCGERTEYVYAADGEWAGKYRPSIHMPRWASRLTLRVLSVRVERLQDISEADAIAEGTERNDSPGMKPDWLPEWGYRSYCQHYPEGCDCFPEINARDGYKGLWDHINGDGAWDANPWVWRVEFEKAVKQ